MPPAHRSHLREAATESRSVQSLPLSCPFLGVPDDPETALAFPSPANYCHRAQPPTAVRADHQQGYCLGAQHTACPIYRARGPVTVPKRGRRSIGEIVAPLMVALSSAIRRARDGAAAGIPALNLRGRMDAWRDWLVAGLRRAGPALAVLALLVAGTVAILAGWRYRYAIAALIPSAPTADLSAAAAVTASPTATLAARATSPPVQPTAVRPAVGGAGHTATPTICAPPAGWTAITVYPEDSLDVLAARYGLTPAELAAANCLSDGRLATGQTAYVPPVTASLTPAGRPTLTPTQTLASTPPPVACGPPPGWVVYAVRRGDTLARLARRFGVSAARLQTANCLADGRIYVGQRLYVPDLPTRTPPPPPPPPPPPSATVPPPTPTIGATNTAVPPTPTATPAFARQTATAVPPTATSTNPTYP